MTSIYDQDLPRNDANFAPISPLSFIERTAEVYPDRLAIVHGDLRQTWAQTYARTRQLASALQKAGIGRNDTVAVMLPNTPPMVEAHFGVPMAGAVLKRYHDEGTPEADKPLLAWSMYNSFHVIEKALSDALRNFPIRPVGWLLWALVFPLGRRAEAPGDRLNHRVASLLMTPNEGRDRLGQGVFLTPCENNPGGRIDSYLAKAVQAEPVERKFLKALKTRGIEALEFPAQLDEAVAEGVITAEERKLLEELRQITLEAITVDDFDAHELRAASYYDKPDAGNREAA